MSKITIIIAVYNGAKTLQRAIDSFANQDYIDKELIVIDGKSTDGTVKVIRDNEGVIDYWVSEEDRGIHDAWNKGLSVMTGAWVIFLGADDTFSGCTVLSDFSIKQKYVESKLIYGQVQMKSEAWIDLSLEGEEWGAIKKIFMTSENKIPHQGLFHHESLFSKYGGFNTKLDIAGDYDFLVRCVRGGVLPVFISGLVVANMQCGGVSNEHSMRLATYLEFGVVRRNAGWKVYSLDYIFILIKGYLRKKKAELNIL